MSDVVLYLNDFRPSVLHDDGGKSRIQSIRQKLGLSHKQYAAPRCDLSMDHVDTSPSDMAPEST
jgi:hypothetical protein